MPRKKTTTPADGTVTSGKPKTQKFPSPGIDIWVVEDSVSFSIPKVQKYRVTEVRASGIKVLFRGTWKFIGPAIGRRWFTDRSALEHHMRRVLESNLLMYLGRAREVAEALGALPELEMSIVPPAERATFDKRPEI
jgi:hypothetical protein